MHNVSKRRTMNRNISLSFDQWTPEDIAVSLTHIEFKMLRRITFADYCEYAIRNQLHRVPALQRSIAVFNSISRWVQCMVLSKTTTNERAAIIMKFVWVAEHLRHLNNFNTLMAVVGGLTHSALARLRKTSLCISQECRTTLTEFSNLLSSDSNFSAYRKALNSCHTYRIPIIGVHLKDLIALHSATPDYVSEDLINCRKLTQLVLIFKHLVLDLDRPQMLPDLNEDLIHTLKVALSMPYSDDEIYALSLCREPRSLLRPTVRYAGITADWAEGVCSRLEPLVLQKHVHAMVEAVFKHYDLDKDGYISQEEFELFAGNFPLIESFSNFDTDHKKVLGGGPPSWPMEQVTHVVLKDENKPYGYVNNDRPILWGLLRQGLKCQECGIAVHRGCIEKSSSCIRRRSSERVRCKSFSPSESPEIEQKLQPRYNSFKHHLLNFTWNKSRSRHSSRANATSPESVSPVNAHFLTVADSKQRSWSESGHYCRYTVLHWPVLPFIQTDTLRLRNNSPFYDQNVSLASEEVFDVEEAN
ncbi:unnamed protein product [Soboliphyme baturini]|uniref:RAS guanyl releasing protein 2 n=1 Tax=Soboliphyme baturini TaxID=241478 RepID=A0A183IGU7_9BILA|nr:unnamed protein product [Soboliphyme baturini]